MMLVDIYPEYSKCLRTRDRKNRVYKEKGQIKEQIKEPKNSYRQCGNKVRYDSIYEAHKFAKLYEKTRDVKLHCYECLICGGYHLTKQEIKAKHTHIQGKVINRINARVF